MRTNNLYQEAEVSSWAAGLMPAWVAAPIPHRVLLPDLSNKHQGVGLPSQGCFLVELIADDKVLDKHGLLNGILFEPEVRH